jgi:hypothetical protein
MTREEIPIMLWQDGCHHELHRSYEGRPIAIWIPCERYRAAARQLDAPDCRISLVPRTEKDKPWMTGRAPVVWVALQTRPATQALERFRPAPTFVLRAGRSSFRWAVWALSRPLWGAYIEQATQRLAYHLRGLRKAASVEALLPAPWAIVDGRQIWIEFEQPETFTARQVVGHLRDAPPIDTWRRRAA